MHCPNFYVKSAAMQFSSLKWKLLAYWASFSTIQNQADIKCADDWMLFEASITELYNVESVLQFPLNIQQKAHVIRASEWFVHGTWIRQR